MDSLLEFLSKIAYWCSDLGVDRLFDYIDKFTDTLHNDYKKLYYLIGSLLAGTQWKFAKRLKDWLKGDSVSLASFIRWLKGKKDEKVG